MFKDLPAFCGFSVDDIDTAKQFYGTTLGLAVEQSPEGLFIHLGGGGGRVFVYPSSTYVAPNHTVLNFIVPDIDEAVTKLEQAGISMEHYDRPEMKTDERGILRNDGAHPGPAAIAWFKDPAGHILSVIQET